MKMKPSSRIFSSLAALALLGSLPQIAATQNASSNSANGASSAINAYNPNTWSNWNQSKAVEQSLAAVQAGKDPLPGVRSCFWPRGPFSADPYLNIAYPEGATFYWGAAFTIPPGAKLHLEGNFPRSRYMSLMSYDSVGRPLESVADYLIAPLPGHVNPFIIGADRLGKERGYKLEVVNAPVPANRVVGVLQKGELRDKLHAPAYGSANQQAIIYRIYANDKGFDETGGAGLPQPVLTLASGQILKGEQACQALRTRQPLQVDPTALALPARQVQELMAAAKAISPTHPATAPATWHININREYLYDIYRGKPADPAAQRTDGGFYPNIDIQYIRTYINRKHGKVFMLRGKAPTTPRTVNGDAKMGDGQLRYWSFCSNQGFLTTRVNACVHDETIPLDANGYYTIALSRAADRPRNAQLQCGVAWLPMADDGDGGGDEDMTLIGLRHMLVSADFKQAVQGINNQGSIAKDMGDYFPQSRYMSISGFETAIPCLIEKR